MVFSDLVHSLWILLTNASFGLLVMEGWKRRSIFYVALFASLGALSFALHCEETGICSPLSPKMHKRLQTADLGLSYFLFGVMLLTVLEIRMEVTGRMVAAAFAILITARDIFDQTWNVVGLLAMGAGLLIIDAIVNKRRFRPAWWRRLALICGMAAAGALLFRALKSLWAVHGLFHLYYVSACYLVLVAERHKKTAAASSSRSGGGYSSSSSSSAAVSRGAVEYAGSARSGPFGAGSATAAALSLTSTPLKRKDAGSSSSSNVDSSSSISNGNGIV